jgi:undecaprenyl-diphosphatase
VPLVATAAFACVFALVKARRSDAFDLAMTLKLQGARRPALDRAMAAVSWPGVPPQSRTIPPLLSIAWFATGHPRAAVFQMIGWVPALLATALKAVMQRPRPLPPSVRVVVAPLGGSSFPSGHVLTYVGVYGTLAYLLAAETGETVARDVSIAGLLTLIGLVGPSRVEQGHHWTTDVVASYLIGISFLSILTEAYARSSST